MAVIFHSFTKMQYYRSGFFMSLQDILLWHDKERPDLQIISYITVCSKNQQNAHF